MEVANAYVQVGSDKVVGNASIKTLNRSIQQDSNITKYFKERCDKNKVLFKDLKGYISYFNRHLREKDDVSNLEIALDNVHLILKEYELLILIKYRSNCKFHENRYQI
ncbi:hypothetical protein GLOIN_2v1713008 [Rhizophagus irregularis DAOM 181602=DAOM 197198]|nr:hypothetical protein GLOIN_2v1713008 [Rhizophagus irregularis DAOM 181602=DAOM 197198]